MQNPTLLLAPFKGLTEKMYRNAVARHFGGYDFMYAPFISGTGRQRVNPAKLEDVMPKADMLTPTIPQLLSNDASEVILIGKALELNGYTHVNWNMGCPFTKIALKKKGCGILPFPGELDRMLERVFREFPLKLSIKTRLGYYNSDEITKAIEVFNRYPVYLLIVHARIGTQLYSGTVNLKGFENCLEMARIPVAYNGDIFTKARFEYLQDKFPGVNSWMLGRGALINPFLASEIRGTRFTESLKRKLLLEFLFELETLGIVGKPEPDRFLGYLKAVWFYLAGLFEKPEEFSLKIRKSRTLEEYRKVKMEAISQPFAADEGLERYVKLGVKHAGS
ncbi:MAG TPA: tRNA-dihydrouridine synthase family protein [Bacteroidales bacterium]|nr:tRNA-dihydrouridine synthase family protein [Bacteroidales bacterium]